MQQPPHRALTRIVCEDPGERSMNSDWPVTERHVCDPERWPEPFTAEKGRHFRDRKSLVSGRGRNATAGLTFKGSRSASASTASM